VDKRSKEYKQIRLFTGRIVDSFELRKSLTGRGYLKVEYDREEADIVTVTEFMGSGYQGKIRKWRFQITATCIEETTVNPPWVPS
jgi:ribosomal protein L3